MIEKLASQLGRNDEMPNIELAELLCATEDADGIAEIVEGLKGKNKAIANDCIKVLYEVGERKPALIAEHAPVFLSLICSKNNRLAWGAMTALATITELVPDIVYGEVAMVLKAFREGSVITVDYSVTVLSELCKANPEHESHLFPILLEHLKECRPKEVPQHAERMSVCINDANRQSFFDVLEARRAHLSDSQVKRIEKLKKRLL
jgi:hypothetical protein